MLAAVCSVATGQIADPSATDEIDSQFLNRLSRRQLFDVATDFARERIRQQRDPESQAYWTDRLAHVYLQRMWQESRVNRQALMQQSAELITEFLEGQIVRPETALAMRLTQIESLLNLADINLLLNTVGHRGPQPQAPELAAAGVLPLVDQGQELVDALLRQLQQNRGSLARREAGWLRERGMRLAVQLEVTRWLASEAGAVSGAQSSPSWRQLRDRVRSVSRAARSDESRQVAALLLADLQIAAGDGDALRLIVRDQQGQLTEKQRLILRLRMLLREDKATEALEESYAAVNQGPKTPGEVSLLRMESLLLQRMQADDLQDTPLKTRSDSEFAKLAQAIPVWPDSVWKDAATNVVQRYRLIETVGGDVAELVEQVQLLRDAGKPDQAVRVLKRALNLLPANASAQSRAAIRLRLGEILISQQEWDEARPLLQESVRLFAEAGQSSAGSTAALLDVYCIGQQWRLQPANETLRDEYFQGLMEHRQRWGDETSGQQATEWLIQLTQQIDPLLTAEVLAEQAAAAASRPEKFKQLIRLGEQLELARDSVTPTRSQKTWAELVTELTKTCEDGQLLVGDLTDASARLLLLCTSLTTDSRTELAVWGRLHRRLADVESAVIDADPVTRQRLCLLQLLAEVRSTTDSQRATQRRTKYAVEVRDAPAQAARQLARYLSDSGRIQPGDRAIAETLEKQLTELIPSAITAADLSGLLTMATLAGRVTRHEDIRQDLISRLLKLDLTTAQTTQVAAALMASSTQLNGPAAESLRRLWQRIHDESREGDELWLESCLQLAQFHAAAGHAADAARQLEVTSVIYPDWGSVERKRRVQQFLQQVRSAEGSD